MRQGYDFIIAGAGSAGCVLANRLSADPTVSVLLLEAGRRSRSLYTNIPAAFPFAGTSPRHSWGYVSAPEPWLDGRPVPCPRGRAIGGSSVINAMAFVRGHPADFDRWAERAGPSWSYESCLPHFKAIERFSGGGSRRGDRGELSVIAPRYSNPLNEIFLRACVEAGYTLNPDTNGSSQDGFGPMDQTIRGGRRDSAATAFLDPVRRRRNLTILPAATVTGIVIEGARATGVEFVHGREKRAQAVVAGEVVLSAGAINSPQLLMLSGVGPADVLKHLAIGVKADLPQVGRGLQDHVDVSLKQVCVQPLTITPQLAPLRKAVIGMQWLLTRTGPGATSHFEVAGYIRTSGRELQPDIQLCFVPLLAGPDGRRIGSVPHGFQVTIMLLQPQSEGTVSLTSADPREPPQIVFNYLGHPNEMRRLREGVRALRRVLQQPAIARYCGPEIEPGPDATSDDQLDRFIRRTVKSTHHPCGTCRMGTDGDAVVDSEGRVHGVAALRVVDASIMPAITSGNINAPTMMIAQKIAKCMVN